MQIQDSHRKISTINDKHGRNCDKRKRALGITALSPTGDTVPLQLILKLSTTSPEPAEPDAPLWLASAFAKPCQERLKRLISHPRHSTWLPAT